MTRMTDTPFARARAHVQSNRNGIAITQVNMMPIASADRIRVIGSFGICCGWHKTKRYFVHTEISVGFSLSFSSFVICRVILIFSWPMLLRVFFKSRAFNCISRRIGTKVMLQSSCVAKLKRHLNNSHNSAPHATQFSALSHQMTGENKWIFGYCLEIELRYSFTSSWRFLNRSSKYIYRCCFESR